MTLLRTIQACRERTRTSEQVRAVSGEELQTRTHVHLVLDLDREPLDRDPAQVVVLVFVPDGTVPAACRARACRRLQGRAL